MTFRGKKFGVALRVIAPTVSVAFLLCAGHSDPLNANDAPPVVTITAPRNNSAYRWNILVNYSIVVTYRGKSTQYQEIPSNQILLSATYVPDVSTVVGKPASVAGRPPAGLLEIIRSNCLGCHEFNAKAMGPSLAAIAERYGHNQATIDTLSGHIHNGSTGVWGQDSMPPHPELTEDQVHAIVHWIMNNAGDPDVSYYVGTEGAIWMKAPGKPDSKGGMLLTASYSSPGPSANTEQAQYGEDAVIIHGN